MHHGLHVDRLVGPVLVEAIAIALGLVGIGLRLDAPDVVVELVGHLGDAVKMPALDADAPTPAPAVTLGWVVASQRHGALEGVADLPAAPHGANLGAAGLLALEEGFGVGQDVFHVHLDQAAPLELLQEEDTLVVFQDSEGYGGGGSGLAGRGA
ncbi:hypothetical protein GGTG_12597 [Gaeumannomyces tritici R3-111a-1]|uniref:Uncharacterized protein n=1 Tax=Gaeumannomyces tritici (strain R3-111a-1) TaxID=644352 RepID=J3PGH2_GAET3|nr:hypothetical protein GGTG_12597 [Gaeumannomyces tritici R3-111a-1]EJT69714.1 hypothetical protein GGTG_12597 [Gaeumannomyces tritici R3-111a-1]